MRDAALAQVPSAASVSVSVCLPPSASAHVLAGATSLPSLRRCSSIPYILVCDERRTSRIRFGRPQSARLNVVVAAAVVVVVVVSLLLDRIVPSALRRHSS